MAELKSSLIRLGAVYDWRREIWSHDPEYIKWNQVIFLKLWEAGLAYRQKAPVNWCPGCQTVLANEQVLADGTCERSGDLVERRELEQWFFRITAYADELLEALDDLDWPEQVKVMQRNWIGRSEGAEFDLVVEGNEDLKLRVFTTRPDTSFGMTYAVIAPEHPLLDALTTDPHRKEVEQLRQRASHETDIERMSEGDPAALDKRGAFTGTYVVNPFNGEPVPLYVADYVLMGYGTGAIMAVPAEDERDWAFATLHKLPIVRTVQPPEGWEAEGAVRTRGTASRSTAASSTGSTSPRPRRGPSIGWRSRGSASARSTTACATGLCRGSGSGAAPFPPCTATTTAWCRFPRTSSPCLRPTMSSSFRRGSRRS